jgi:ribosomal-protein-alanine N-acetyltransferase
MPFTFEPMDNARASALLTWRYESPYDLYNLNPDDEEAKGSFLDPRNDYHAILDDRGNLVAFCCFGLDARVPGGDYECPALDIGLGVRPDLTGQGNGHRYVESVLGFARRRFAPATFRVTIAGFNQRALRVWERAGFRPVQRFEREPDGRAFVVLVHGTGPNVTGFARGWGESA